MSTELVRFKFKGDDLEIARLRDGDVGASVRRLCEAVGLKPEAQLKRLARAAATGAKWACTSIMEVQVGGQRRKVVFLPRTSIPMWAATLEASRVKASVRPKIVAYQNEAADVLAAAFLGTKAGTTKGRAFPDRRRVKGEAAKQMAAVRLTGAEHTDLERAKAARGMTSDGQFIRALIADEASGMRAAREGLRVIVDRAIVLGRLDCAADFIAIARKLDRTHGGDDSALLEGFSALFKKNGDVLEN